MNGFCFIVHVFCMEQKKNTHIGRAETLCALTWVRALKHWPLGQQAVLSRSQSCINKKEKNVFFDGERRQKVSVCCVFISLFPATKSSTMLLLWWFDDDKSSELTFWPFYKLTDREVQLSRLMLEDDWKDLNDFAASWCPAACSAARPVSVQQLQIINQGLRVSFFLSVHREGFLLAPPPHLVMDVPQKLHLSFDIVVSVPRA